MAYDKVVDSAELDADLTAIANAIRSKTGKTEGLTLEQMPGEIEGIETGGGGKEIFYALSGVPYTRNTVLEETVSIVYPARNRPSLTVSQYSGAIEMETFTTNYTGLLGSQYCFGGCSKLREAYFPKATGLWLGNTHFFSDNPALEKVSIGSIGCAVTRMDAGSFRTPPITLELYVAAETIADIPDLIRNYVPGSWNADAIVIYRNSTTGEVITE